MGDLKATDGRNFYSNPGYCFQQNYQSYSMWKTFYDQN